MLWCFMRYFLLFLRILMAMLLKMFHRRTCKADRREQTGNDADDKRQREVLDGSNAENIHHTDGQKRCNGGVYRTAEGAADTVVHLFGKRYAAAHDFVVFTDTVKDDNGRIDRITENGQKCGDDGGVHRNVEKRICHKHNKNVMDKAGNRRKRRADLEAQSDIHKHQDNGRQPLP